MIDSTIVPAHQQAATGKRGACDQALGRSRGGLTTKIHMLADALGRPVCIVVTAGHVGDITQAPASLEGQSGDAVPADNADDSNALRAIIAAMRAEAVIPSNRCRKVAIPYDAIIYKHRNRIDGASANSSTSDASQHATTVAPATSTASYISPPP